MSIKARIWLRGGRDKQHRFQISDWLKSSKLNVHQDYPKYDCRSKLWLWLWLRRNGFFQLEIAVQALFHNRTLGVHCDKYYASYSNFFFALRGRYSIDNTKL